VVILADVAAGMAGSVAAAAAGQSQEGPLPGSGREGLLHATSVAAREGRPRFVAACDAKPALSPAPLSLTALVAHRWRLEFDGPFGAPRRLWRVGNGRDEICAIRRPWVHCVAGYADVSACILFFAGVA
jgi:hypothetical protein